VGGPPKKTLVNLTRAGNKQLQFLSCWS